MASQTLVRPIENIDDATEEAVLAIIAHLTPVLQKWRAGEDYRLELSDTANAATALDNEIKELGAQIEELQERKNALIKEYASPSMLMLIAGATLIILGLAVGMASTLGTVICVFGVGSLTTGAVRLSIARKEISASERELQTTQDIKRSEYQRHHEKVTELKREISARVDAFPEVQQFKAAFPMRVTSILGNQVLIDESGIFSNTPLRTVDLTNVGSAISSLESRINDLRNVPVLLDPKMEPGGEDPVDSVYGEEADLKGLIDDFMESVGNVNDVEISVPLVPRTNLLSRRLAERADYKINYPPGSILAASSGVANDQVIKAFVDRFGSVKEIGVDVLKKMEASFSSLQQICDSYSSARSDSITHVHKNLFDVLNKASWCSKRFYCPRTIRAPDYIESILKVSPKDAHKLDFETLMGNLQADPVVGSRVRERPELSDELYVIHRAIHDLAADMDMDEEGNPLDLGHRPSYVTEQFSESLSRFRRMLNVIVTGAANPVLTFSREAEMKYEPDLDEWRSDTIPYVYSTADMQAYGQVLKVTTDLLVPLWEHLWTEKADFRKSELFRTNESLIRMTEKESEKLIDVANQFRGDMRTVRENVYRLESDLSAKHDELVAFRDGMSALGLLSERQKLLLSDEKLSALAPDDRSLLEEGEGFETILGNEPRQQAERRGTAGDPIEFVRSPDSLISYRAAGILRLAQG